MKLQRVAVISKFGSKESEDTAKKVAKKFLGRNSKVYTISPVDVEGAKKVDAIEDLKKEKLDLAVTLGGDGTTLRALRHLENDTPV